jgi:UDP-N-acetylmuramate dehydrogenase
MNKNNLNFLIDFCVSNNISFELDCSLKKYNSFKVGGVAQILVKPASPGQTLLLEHSIGQKKIPFFLLGGGSNLIISEECLGDLFIKLQYPEKIEIFDKNDQYIIYKAPANMRSSLFAKKVSQEGYSGAEFLATIPGTLGGAVVQNAGCYGGEIRHILAAVEYIEKAECKFESAEKLQFSYRNSIFKQKKNRIIHYVYFKLSYGDRLEIQNKIKLFQKNREVSQPRNKKNAGSIFKNPDGQKAWYYIQNCDLKGFKIGDAMISPEHANFIVNIGHATSTDVVKLIKLVQDKVYDKFRVWLEPEVEFVGKFK